MQPPLPKRKNIKGKTNADGESTVGIKVLVHGYLERNEEK
jgi:hypothetical protein